jgi:hypothetical protein
VRKTSPRQTQVVGLSWVSIRAFATVLVLAALCALLYLRYVQGQAPIPRSAKLAAPHEIQIPYGTLTLPKGTPVVIIQESGSVVTVRTANNQEFSVARNQVTW